MQLFLLIIAQKSILNQKNRSFLLIASKKQHGTMINKINNTYCNQSQCLISMLKTIIVPN